MYVCMYIRILVLEYSPFRFDCYCACIFSPNLTEKELRFLIRRDQNINI